MSEFKLRTLANFASEVEARTLEAALATQGIACLLNNPVFLANFWQYGNAVGGVSVQVSDQDWDAAQAVLGANPEGVAAWVCSVCQAENELGFDLCWQCGHECSESATGHKISDNSGSALDRPTQSSAHPEVLSVSSDQEDLRRAWRAAIVGIVIPFGLLSLYSMALLIRTNLDVIPDEERWKFVAAWLVNLAVLLIILSLLRPF